MPVNFFNIEIKTKIKEQRIVRTWINEIIKFYSNVPGTINIILVSDDYLLDLNQKHLSGNYYTDILTFNFNEGKIISGDLYISLDRIKENASKFGNSASNELLRVIVHGILHLLGYDDHNEDQKVVMQNAENEALRRIPTVDIL